jgi:hypothetical protein
MPQRCRGRYGLAANQDRCFEIRNRRVINNCVGVFNESMNPFLREREGVCN